ncbi:MAG: hypothetical protein QM802_14730 [Agriterribacter sp.]
MSKPKVLITGFGYVFSEPPSRNTMLSFLDFGYKVSVIHLKKHSQEQSFSLEENIETEFVYPKVLKKIRVLKNILEWISYKKQLNRWISSNPGAIVWVVHFTAVAAINFKMAKKKKCFTVCNVVDIPLTKHAGNFDRWINKKGWRKIRDCDLTVSSDSFKADLAKMMGNLEKAPLVCHNCPRLSEFDEVQLSANKWLRNELIRQGASITFDSAFILLRAGAIGELGGIEETIDAMQYLPKHFIFLMMGRPEKEFELKINALIKQKDLAKRVFLWVRPSDEIWKKTLLGADVGHLVHIKSTSGPYKEMYELNSSLSNNRLFQYMAAGIPIVSYEDSRMDSIYNEIHGFCKLSIQNIFIDTQKVLLNLAADKEYRLRLGTNNRQAFLKKYNWENQFKPVYEEIISENSYNLTAS